MDLDRLEEVEDVGPDWSVSRLQTIFSCGRRYRYKYVDRIEEPPTVALAFGSAVHECIADMYLNNRWDDTYMQRLWAYKWQEKQEGIDWDSVRDRKSNRDKKGVEILEAFRETSANDNWYALESHFRFRINDRHGNLPQLRGTFDKIMRLEDGRLAVIDYKTSKNPPDPLLLRVDPQLTIYREAAKEILGEDVVLGIHHLLTNTLYLTERTDRDMLAIIDMLKVGVERVEQGRFERNISWGCRYCPFKDMCLGGLANGES